MSEFILQEIRDAVRERVQVETRILAMVAAARREGHSWEKIAQALGVSRPAAWERYAPQVEPHRDPS